MNFSNSSCSSIGDPHATFNPEGASHANYPFLVHSHASLAHNVLPRVDDTMMSRQKRRRTSPEDQAALEAAYQRNSKPDKAERIAIVSRVRLGEKEVQIWFQNRRQNDRRKSRPLLPHEMVPHFRNPIPQQLLHNSTSAYHEISSTPDSSFSSMDDDAQSPSSTNSQCNESKPNASRASSIHDLLNPATPSGSSCSTSFESHPAQQASSQHSTSATGTGRPESVDIPESCHNNLSSRSPRTAESDDGNSTHVSAQADGQHLGNQSRNAGAAITSATGSWSPTVEKSHSQSYSCLVNATINRKRLFDEIEEHALPTSQSSGIRLSMALDGAVKIRTTDEETPSPPKQRPPHNQTAGRKEGVKRSHSAATASDLVLGGQNRWVGPAGGIFGRSRDARTWEFYCDGDARAALASQADNENNGSAVGAINLIRSQSHNARFRSAQEKGPALQAMVGGGKVRIQAALGRQKPKLVRAMSSMARLPSNSKEDMLANHKTGGKSQARSPSGDSDKENWVPGTRRSDSPWRRVQASTNVSRGVSQDQLAASSPRISGNGKRRAHIGIRQSGCSPEKAPPGKDGPDTGSFSHGESQGEDLDCIQGLLSLSQGTWK